MQVQVDPKFDQLVRIAKGLPTSQWKKLRQEVEGDEPAAGNREHFRRFLLNAPTFNQRQLDTMAETRRKIDEWRTK